MIKCSKKGCKNEAEIRTFDKGNLCRKHWKERCDKGEASPNDSLMYNIYKRGLKK